MNKKSLIAIIALFVAIMAIQPASAAEYAYLIEITGTTFLPHTIYAGDAINMAVDIKNKGTSISATSLEATLDIGGQFEAIKLEESLNSINPGSTKTLVFSFKAKESTLPGYYPASLKIEYMRNNEPVSEIQTILIPVSKTEKNISVTMVPQVINPGKQTEAVFTLKNVGETPASNILFSWEEENDLVLPLGSDNKRFVSILKSKTAIEIPYTIAADPNISTGLYPLNITMTFTDVNGTKTQTSQVGLVVGGTTDFEVSAETLGTGQVSISIANIGSNNAGAVVVRVLEQQGMKVSGSNTAILGNLNKGDFTLANFQIQTALFDQNLGQREGFGGSRPPLPEQGQEPARKTANSLPIEIDYTDTTGERQSIQKTVQLAPSAAGLEPAVLADRFRQRTSTSSFIPWILLVLIVFGAIAFNKFKAGKSWKKLAKTLAVAIILFLAAIFLLGSDVMATGIAGVISIALLAWLFLKKGK